MRKIILLCSAGMSTSMLVKKMQEAAAAENPDYNRKESMMRNISRRKFVKFP